MPTYISLINWTEQGIKGARDTVQRVEDARGVIQKMGGQLKEVYWTQGRYDMVVVVEWPDDESATAFLLTLGGLGNVRSETLRAFNAQEMGRIIGKMPQR